MEQFQPNPVPSHRDQQQFLLLEQLQTALKDEYFLLATQSEQKMAFERKTQSAMFDYYRSTVNLGQILVNRQEKGREDKPFSSFSSDKSEKGSKGVRYDEEKRLLTEEGFGSAYIFVKEIVLSLSKDPSLMVILIRKYQSSLPAEAMGSLAKVIISSMYENIVDDDVYHKDILKIVIFCIRELIEGKQHPRQVNLLDKGFIQAILAEMIERTDTKQYAKRVGRNALLQIAKIDHALEFRPINEEERSRKESLKLERQDSHKYLQSMPRTNNSQQTEEEKRSKVRHYSDSLRLYDEKNKKGTTVKRKYRNCMSNDLLNELGIYEDIVFPCFSSKGQSIKDKEQSQVGKQLGKMLYRSQSKQQTLANNDIHTVKNIILIFFNDVFKALYSMPSIIRISSRALYNYLKVQFTPEQAIDLLQEYIINFWLLSALRIDPNVIESSRLSQHLQGNAELVVQMIKNIVMSKLEKLDPLFLQEYNQMATNLKASIANYIHEVINIDNDSIQPLCRQVDSYFHPNKDEKRLQTNNIKSYCVCISVTDLKCLIEMVKGAEKELAQVNDKLAKRVQRIELMTQDNDIFGDKKDKSTGKLYRANKAYVLFTDLAMPSHLNFDYLQNYKASFKQSKIKNLLRQVLLSMNNVQVYPEFHDSNHLEDFFSCLYFSNETATLYSIDNIPLNLKLQYLQVLGRKERLKQVAIDLYDDTKQRLAMFRDTWSGLKDCYLLAITSINFQANKLAAKEELIRDEAKRRKLQEFFSKHEIRLCLTSPKSREKQLILKTNLMKEVREEYRDKLWLQNQSKCIHTALNLQFIKSLTGQPEKSRSKYESHINSIMKFSEILCSLPEVKQRFSMTQDSIGVKEVFFEFVQYIRDLIKSKEADFSILLENLEWLQQNIQLKISKRLYDKLYPRHPLYDDIALHLRLKTLHWVTFDHLGIEHSLRNEQVWQVAANQLKLIDKLRTAAEKLHCIQETSKIIFNSYTLMAKGGEAGNMGAQQIYPLVILVLIRAAPKRLISSINFIECFASQSKLLSKEGYCFTQLKAAIQYCDNLTSDNVAMLSDAKSNYIQFNKRIYEKEIQFGIYFMLGKAKGSSEGEKFKQDRLEASMKQQRMMIKNERQ